MEVTDGEIIGYLHRLNGNEFEQAQGVGDGQGRLVAAVQASQRVRHD